MTAVPSAVKTRLHNSYTAVSNAAMQIPVTVALSEEQSYATRADGIVLRQQQAGSAAGRPIRVIAARHLLAAQPPQHA